jgi:hypothetical protein
MYRNRSIFAAGHAKKNALTERPKLPISKVLQGQEVSELDPRQEWCIKKVR